MALHADITYSPDDGGYYAHIWSPDDKTIDETLPEGDGVYPDFAACEWAVRPPTVPASRSRCSANPPTGEQR